MGEGSTLTKIHPSLLPAKDVKQERALMGLPALPPENHLRSMLASVQNGWTRPVRPLLSLAQTRGSLPEHPRAPRWAFPSIGQLWSLSHVS